MAPGTSLSRLLRPSICSSCRQSMRKGRGASLSTSARLSADETRPPPATSQPAKPAADADAADVFKEMTDMLKGMDSMVSPRSTLPNQSTSNLLGNIIGARNTVPVAKPGQDFRPAASSSNAAHHLHIYAHKHNTHIVLTRPNREPILSYSAGNIGFRKAQRGSFDAAFQLAAYVMRTITDKGLLRNQQFSELSAGRKMESPIKDLEVVLRGFGKGREAVVKALLGTEGRFIRDKIKLVSDDTKLKFGGTRSPNPRRLG